MIKTWLMRWIDTLSKAQRIVVVIALGLALAALGSYVGTLGGAAYGVGGVGGVFGLTLAPVQPDGLRPWLQVIIWLVLIGVWALASIRVLRPAPEKTEP
jgi:hypothetical protein